GRGLVALDVEPAPAQVRLEHVDVAGLPARRGGAVVDARVADEVLQEVGDLRCRRGRGVAHRCSVTSALSVPTSSALLTDHYELTMLQAALRSGAAHRRAVFEVFARHLPHGRRYGVVAGTGRLLDAIERFRFGPADLDFLGGAGIVDEPTLAFLESYRFSGNIWGYSEGDCYFPGSPILVVEGTFAEAVLLETVTLSILNHDCAIACAASRMVTAAGDR